MTSTLTKSKILVTGGMGFIGNSLASKFEKEGYDVFIIDDISNVNKKFLRYKKSNQFAHCDISNKNQLQNILKEIKPDIICHYAADIDVNRSIKFPTRNAIVNILGTINILDSLKDISLSHFIFASSGGAVYGDLHSTKRKFTELDCPHPISPYGFSKLAGENYVQFYCNKIGVKNTIMRYSNVYGGEQFFSNSPGVIVKFLTKMMSGGKIEINGNGLNSRDYVYIDDVISANLAVIQKQQSGVFNIGSGKAVSVNDLVKMLTKVTKKNIDVSYIDPIELEVKETCLGIKKAETELTWRPKFSLLSGVSSTFEQISDLWDNHKK